MLTPGWCARTGITVMCLRRRRASWRQKSQLGQGCRRLGRALRCGCAAYRCVLHCNPLTADQGALLWAAVTRDVKTLAPNAVVPVAQQ